jgi:ketosteroid isomerase-like protein
MKLIAAAIALVLISGAARAEDTAAATAAAVRAADAAFAKRSVEVGAAKAFRETMDPTDSLEFGSGAPIKGAEAIYKSLGGDAPSQTRLEWTPVDAWGSKGGDLGVTTGTWRLSGTLPTAPVITGRYVTVWRKNAAGAWKGLIDIGNPDPK